MRCARLPSVVEDDKQSFMPVLGTTSIAAEPIMTGRTSIETSRPSGEAFMGELLLRLLSRRAAAGKPVPFRIPSESQQRARRAPELCIRRQRHHPRAAFALRTIPVLAGLIAR